MWSIPGPGIKPVSPALAGGFFTTEPPGETLTLYIYGPITLWEIYGETVETVSDFIFGGSKITADGDCSHEIKRPLLLRRKVMTNLDSIFKSRDITLSKKVRLVKDVWM